MTHDCWIGVSGVHERLEPFIPSYVAAIDAHLLVDDRPYRCKEIQAISTNHDSVFGCWQATDEPHHWFNVSCSGLLYGNCSNSNCPAKYFSEVD